MKFMTDDDREVLRTLLVLQHRALDSEEILIDCLTTHYYMSDEQLVDRGNEWLDYCAAGEIEPVSQLEATLIRILKNREVSNVA